MKGFLAGYARPFMLDKINVTTLTAFPLYTLGIVAGLIWAKPVFGATVIMIPEVISIVVWLLFAVLFHNRLANSWKGQTARLAVFIFFSVCFQSLW